MFATPINQINVECQMLVGDLARFRSADMEGNRLAAEHSSVMLQAL